MLQFKKYSSIDNVFTQEFMDRVQTEMPADLEWVVQEKVHGANTSFLCDGAEFYNFEVIGLFAQDALADFLKEHGGAYSALDKYEQKALTRELNGLAGKVVKQEYQSNRLNK